MSVRAPRGREARTHWHGRGALRRRRPPARADPHRPHAPDPRAPRLDRPPGRRRRRRTAGPARRRPAAPAPARRSCPSRGPPCTRRGSPSRTRRPASASRSRGPAARRTSLAVLERLRARLARLTPPRCYHARPPWPTEPATRPSSARVLQHHAGPLRQGRSTSTSTRSRSPAASADGARWSASAARWPRCPVHDDGRVVARPPVPLRRRRVRLGAAGRAAATRARRPRRAPGGSSRRRSACAPRSLEPLLAFWTTPGFCDEVMHLFRATGLEPVPAAARGRRADRGGDLHAATKPRRW